MAGGILDSSTQINFLGVPCWDEDNEAHYRVFGKSNAVRTVLCNWNDSYALINVLGGWAGFNIQNQYQYFLPSPYPDAPNLLFFNGADIAGVGVRHVGPFGMVSYDWARVRILYETLPWNPLNANVLSLDYSVEEIILPQPADSTIQADGSLADASGTPLWTFASTGNNVNAAQIPSRRLVTVSLCSETFNLLSLPTSTLFTYAGAVNSTTFQGAAQGTVMFMGGKSTRRPNFMNVETWDLKKPFIYNSIGWQKVYNPQTGLFEKIVDKNGNPPFSELDLNNVYP